MSLERHFPIIPTLACMMTLGFLGCQTPETPDPTQKGRAEYKGLLRPPSVFQGDYLWRQRVTATWKDGEQSFEAACQKLGNTLRLIGLSPFGSVGFVLMQEDLEIRFENKADLEIPFPPRFVLLDFQRSFFPWVTKFEGSSLDGEFTEVIGEEKVRERWSKGVLNQRSFERVDGEPQGEIRVQYESSPEFEIPSRVTLENPWFGYRLTVETFDETPL